MKSFFSFTYYNLVRSSKFKPQRKGEKSASSTHGSAQLPSHPPVDHDRVLASPRSSPRKAGLGVLLNHRSPALCLYPRARRTSPQGPRRRRRAPVRRRGPPLRGPAAGAPARKSGGHLREARRRVRGPRARTALGAEHSRRRSWDLRPCARPQHCGARRARAAESRRCAATVAVANDGPAQLYGPLRARTRRPRE